MNRVDSIYFETNTAAVAAATDVLFLKFFSDSIRFDSIFFHFSWL